MASDARLSNVEAIRCFAIVSLVAWHSICVYVGWQSFLPDITNAVGGTLLTKFYTYTTSIIIMPDANMPLFVMVSSYVYAYLWNKGAYDDSKVFFSKKIQRLVIPYFVIGTIVVFTISDWNPISILWGEAHHLWFCAMLFWCFVLIRVYQYMPPPLRAFLVCISLIIQFVNLSFDFLGVIKGVRYFPFFLFGYYLYEYLPKYNQIKWPKFVAFFIWVLALFSFIILKRVELVCYAFCLMLFVCVPENVKIPKWISTISSYSFGIYVFHEWFLWNAAHIQCLHPIIIGHQILYPLTAFIIVSFISIVLTKYSLKTKIGRYLLA